MEQQLPEITRYRVYKLAKELDHVTAVAYKRRRMQVIDKNDTSLPLSVFRASSTGLGYELCQRFDLCKPEVANASRDTRFYDTLRLDLTTVTLVFEAQFLARIQARWNR